jgi:hypothetical protein
MVVENVAHFDWVVLPLDNIAQTRAKATASELIVEAVTYNFLHGMSGVIDAGVDRWMRFSRQATRHGSRSLCHKGCAAYLAGSTRAASRTWSWFRCVAGGVCRDGLDAGGIRCVRGGGQDP